MTLKFGPKEYFAFLISILLLADLAIVLDIPFLRQILGFLFLTILPGILILQILKLNKIDSTEKLVLSVGLSIAFLMFFGLLINNLSLSFGYLTPLSIIPLLVSFNIAFVLLAIIGYKTNKDSIFSLPDLNLTTSEKAFLIVPILFPALSIFGIHIMNTTDNNIILMFLLFLIPIYVASICFFNHKFPKRLYPVVIFLISISLLLIFMLRFPHICGHDVHTEYGIYFQTTLDNLHWSILGYSTLDACLSISLLPAIFQSILDINAQEYLFKGVYVSICSFAPLAVYLISKKYIGELYAFLASFFYISQVLFLVVAGSPRTNVAIFFIALTLMVFFNDKIDPLKRRFLFIVFMLSLAISHYSTAYIFFFVILFCWFAVEIFSKINTLKTVKKRINLTMVLLFFAFIFFWYSQVTEAAFNSGLVFIENTFSELNNFFIEESRTQQFKQLVGQELAYPILSRANLAVTGGSFILIAIGVLTMLKRYKEMVAISNAKLKKPDFLKTKFEMEYLVMTLACSGLLVLVVVLPHLSAYGIQRTYLLVQVIVSTCFVMGGMTLSKNLSLNLLRKVLSKTLHGKKPLLKKQKEGKNVSHNSVRKSIEGEKGLQVRAYLIILLILIPYFLFQTGAMYQICGAPVSINLNSEGKGYDLEFVHDSESYAAKWLAMNSEKNIQIYTADWFGQLGLISQGKISPQRIWGSIFSEHKQLKEGYIYLSYNNVIKEKLVTIDYVTYNMTEYSDMFVGKSKVYNSGCAEIYR
jgi:uncharacterized membrane protein